MTQRCSAHGARLRRQRGVTLVELMVAMTIGLIIVAGLAVSFANSNRSSRELDSTSRQIENGRYAVDFLAQEVAAAGFYGEVAMSGAVYTQPDPCATALIQLGWDAATKKRPVAVQGRTDADMAGVACADHASPSNPGVVLRRLDTTTTAKAAVIDAEGYTYLQTSQCNADPANTEFVFASQKDAFTLRNLACNGPGELRRYVSRLYYVASCNECTGSATDTVPTLKRVELRGNTMVVTPIATGIERLAIEYGFDTNKDGTPDVYRLTASGVVDAPDNDWSNVVTARVFVLARTAEETPEYVDTKRYELGLAGSFGPYNDRHKRKVFVTTAKLQNVAGPREK